MKSLFLIILNIVCWNISMAQTYIKMTEELESYAIPDSVFMKSDLKYLKIQGMDCDTGDSLGCWVIKEIPTKIALLTQLEVLSLNWNAIKTIPKELAHLKRLKSLDLSDNLTLTDIDNIALLTSLEELSLYGCGLKQLPKGITTLKNLKVLGLTGNNLKTEDIQNLKKQLSHCSIIWEW